MPRIFSGQCFGSACRLGCPRSSKPKNCVTRIPARSKRSRRAKTASILAPKSSTIQPVPRS